LSSIETEAATRRARTGIDTALVRIRSALDTLRRRHQEDQCAAAHLMIEIQEGLLKSFVSLGMTDRLTGCRFQRGQKSKRLLAVGAAHFKRWLQAAATGRAFGLAENQAAKVGAEMTAGHAGRLGQCRD
jgi:hypothetical protein